MKEISRFYVCFIWNYPSVTLTRFFVVLMLFGFFVLEILALDSCFWIPSSEFLVWDSSFYSWFGIPCFGFLALDSWFWINEFVTYTYIYIYIVSFYLLFFRCTLFSSWNHIFIDFLVLLSTIIYTSPLPPSWLPAWRVPIGLGLLFTLSRITWKIFFFQTAR